jgi:hypothetical protein
MDDKEATLNELRELNEMLDTGIFEFEDWNTSNIGELLILMSNYRGPECKSASIRVFEEFLKWYSDNKRDKYIPERGLETMYSKKCLRNLLKIAKDDSSDEVTRKSYEEEILKNGKRTSIFKKQYSTRQYFIGWGLIYIGCGMIGYGLRRAFPM